MAEYKQLDPVRHMLENPERDLGDTTIQDIDRYVLDVTAEPLTMRPMCIGYSTSIERLFLEILYNAADNVERSRLEGIDPGCIRVSMTHDTIKVRNEGRPISCQLQPGRDMHIPEFIFSNLLTGSNFGGAARKVQTVGGRFGIGCKATNIFSTFFRVTVVNMNEGIVYRQVWRDNMYVQYRPEEGDTEEVKKAKMDAYHAATNPIIRPIADVFKDKVMPASSFTEVEWVVDFQRFYDDDMTHGFAGQRQYTQEMIWSYTKHCADVSATASVQVYFNGHLIDCSQGLLPYARLYFPHISATSGSGEGYIVFRSSDSICALIDSPGAGRTISFVNSVINEEGGVHVDTWKRLLFKPVLEHLKDKVKGSTCKEKDISAHISMILMCRLKNPKYKSQTKDKVTSPKPEVCTKDMDGNLYPADIMKKILYWDGIKYIEQLLQAQVNAIAKKTDGKKNKHAGVPKLLDAGEAGKDQSHMCTLMVTEGDSAAQFAVKGISDGKYIGALPLKGKLLNVSNASILEYAKDIVITEIKKALGLQEGVDYSEPATRMNLRYGRLIILTDQDSDGMHIRFLFLNFLLEKFPSLLVCDFVYIMETPYMRIDDRHQPLIFYYERQYYDWIHDPSIPEQERNRRKELIPKHYKGLGTSTDAEVLDAFTNGKYVIPQWDEKAVSFMTIAFDEGYEDDRKEWLMSWDPIRMTGTHAHTFQEGTISHMVCDSLCGYSWMSVIRAIPSIIDGLKECQRKVMMVVMTLTKEKKVSQLGGQVSSTTDYRHGEQSLYGTIVGLANYYAGSNNIPLIKGNGQYESRLGNGAANERYIYADKPLALKYIFRKEDECILEYNYNGDEQLEPKHYYPIIPIWAVNGSQGIATGYSTDIPSHNPTDIIKYIAWWLRSKSPETSTMGETPPVVPPWYRNYQGQIVYNNNSWYSIGACHETKSRKKIKDIMVTELPVNMTINSYCRYLDTLKEKPLVKNWTHPGKSPMWITDYKKIGKNMPYIYKGEKYVEVLPYIEIEGALGAINYEKGILRALGLVSKISTTNITLLDMNDRPHQYGDKIPVHSDDGSVLYWETGVMRALDMYCDARYDAYTRRRNKMMDTWLKAMEEQELRKVFIMDIIEGRIAIRDAAGRPRKKSDIQADVSAKGYPLAFGNISFYKLGEEGLHEVEREIAKLRAKYDTYASLTPGSLWLKELEALHNYLERKDA